MSTHASSDLSIHPTAINECPHVGAGTRIHAFAQVRRGARIGTDCRIGDYVLVENDVVLGNRVMISYGVQVRDGVTLEDDVYVGPNVTFTNDSFPTNQRHVKPLARTVVQRGASIGGNATILPGLHIGSHAMIEAGSVVTRNVPPHAIIQGNPAVIRSYVRQNEKTENNSVKRPAGLPFVSDRNPDVRGVTVVSLPLISDMRGSLSFAEIGKGLPFVPKRYFAIFDAPTPEVRGEHAHRELHQFLVVLSGHCSLTADDGKHRWETVLDSPKIGVHVSPFVWLNIFGCSPDCVVLVLASDVYKENDYIRNYDEFERLVALT